MQQQARSHRCLTKHRFRRLLSLVAAAQMLTAPAWSQTPDGSVDVLPRVPIATSTPSGLGEALVRAIDFYIAQDTPHPPEHVARGHLPDLSPGMILSDADPTTDQDVTGAEIAGPEITGPEITGPDVTVPEIAGPEITGPEFVAPEFLGPVVASPEIAVGLVPMETAGEIASHIPPAVSRGPFEGHLDYYRARAAEIADDTRVDAAESGTVGPASFDVWWDAVLSMPLGIEGEAIPIDISSLTLVTLESSPLVQGILTEPMIRRNDLVIADAEFDSLAFVEAKFADTNDPIGSKLTTGNNADRYRDETFSSEAGIRKKTRRGAALEVVQRGGFQENNSTFLDPNPQGTTRLELNFSQPLLKDGGRAVNLTRVMIANIDVKLADSEVRSELEDHLLDVTRAYWGLFQARAEWLQRNRLLEGAVRLYDILAARGAVDSLQRQILRARVAVKSRRSDLVRAEARIRNAQAQLRLLTGSPQLIGANRFELTPQDRPLAYPVSLSTREATITALDNRPDIAQSLRNIQSVSLRVGAAKNQVLPRLDLILSSYVAGLDGGTDTFGAWAKQFSEGRPSYTAGLLLEVPIGNRASRARLAANRWEFRRAMYQFQHATEVVFAEVEIAVRETQTAFDEMATKKQAIDAAEAEVSYLQQRWELLPDPGESAILLIEDLLDAQERLADEERAFVTAQVSYAISWVQLRKAMGVLLRLDAANHTPVIPGSVPDSQSWVR
jgi:outer membrane protein TolC